ncbi:MAG: Fe-S cluster assembly protein SufD [Burkholderiales bacterium]|jgi:Fe-S cluster assembly protein SufD|nr:Fe-S cluster assembly protein SufD [Burkholderiales bacterium]
MADVTSHAFLEALLAPVAHAPSGPLKALRAAALDRAHAAALPTARDEDWRFVDLAPLYKLAFRAPVDGTAVDVADPAVATAGVDGPPEAAAHWAFVDGRFAPARSRTTLPAGVDAFVLGESTDPATLPAWADALGTLVGTQADVFAEVNTAMLRDALLLRVRRGCVVDAPLSVAFVTTQTDVAVHPRVLLVVEDGAQVTLVEQFGGSAAGAYLVNAVCEVRVGAGAQVAHVRVQQDAIGAFHLANSIAQVGRDGRYVQQSVALGARLSRHGVRAVQAGEGAHLGLDGLALIGGRQVADTHSTLDHAFAHGSSRQTHKCVVAGGAHAVFNGRILVRHGAQQTDSAQESRNLLLSERARVDTKPQLEIFADDVRCAHGATVGQLEAEEVFYLRSRGLTEADARTLLTFGFAADIVDRVPVASLRARLRDAVTERTGLHVAA